MTPAFVTIPEIVCPAIVVNIVLVVRPVVRLVIALSLGSGVSFSVRLQRCFRAVLLRVLGLPNVFRIEVFVNGSGDEEWLDAAWL